MSQLIVRDIDAGLVRALKRRAARHGRSAEAEHREILREALEAEARGRSFKAFLATMPSVGRDVDLEVARDYPRGVAVPLPTAAERRPRAGRRSR
jgi:plasmid stability protein